MTKSDEDKLASIASDVELMAEQIDQWDDFLSSIPGDLKEIRSAIGFLMSEIVAMRSEMARDMHDVRMHFGNNVVAAVGRASPGEIPWPLDSKRKTGTPIG